MSTVEKIGIFKGREKTYNKLILKTLFLEGSLKEWELAKKVYEKMKETKTLPKKWGNLNWYQITQKIYSVFIRKEGRLDDLYNKGYIERQKETKVDLWCLSFKGKIATIILDRKLLKEKSKFEESLSARMQNVKKTFEKLQEDNLKITFFGQTIKTGSIFSRLLQGLDKTTIFSRGLPAVASIVEKAIENGVNLDTVKENDLLLLVLMSLRMGQRMRV